MYTKYYTIFKRSIPAMISVLNDFFSVWKLFYQKGLLFLLDELPTIFNEHIKYFSGQKKYFGIYN